ncbi:MAG TPA: hypothetical protein VGD63_17210 [Steroidobacteraceae bacterium]
MRNISALATVLALWLCVIHGAFAQVERSGGANAQLAMQYQQLQAEKTQLQTENSKLKADLDAVKKQLDTQAQQLRALKASAGGAQTALITAQSTVQRTEQNLTQTTAKLQELIARFRETATTLRQVETDRTDLQQQVSRGTTALDQCAQRNEQLYQINAEVLSRYEHEGVFGRLAAAEPFTRLKRTQIENIALEDRQRAEALRIQRAVPATPPAK